MNRFLPRVAFGQSFITATVILRVIIKTGKGAMCDIAHLEFTQDVNTTSVWATVKILSQNRISDLVQRFSC